MKRQQQYLHRLQTLSALHDAVGAMRSLAAHHFRQVRAGLLYARSYRDEIHTILDEIGLPQSQRPRTPAAMLVVASDLGLCGDYNSRIARQATAEAAQHGVATVYCVGRRIEAALAKQDISIRRSYDAPASLVGLSKLILALAEDVFEDYSAHSIGSLRIVSASFEGIGHFRPTSIGVLPIRPTDSAKSLRPSPYISAKELIGVAVREHLYITLYEILLEALAAEHGMRLTATESALDWLEDVTTTTRRRLTNARSEAATQELLDIVTGSRAHRH